MSTVVWTPRALADLHAIGARIAADKPNAAVKWLAKLLARAEAAAFMPTSGHVVPEFGRPELRRSTSSGTASCTGWSRTAFRCSRCSKATGSLASSTTRSDGRVTAVTVDALATALTAAHPRSVQLLRRAFLEPLPRAEFDALYGVSPAAGDALIARALEDAKLNGHEAALQEHRAELLARLDAAAKAWAASPDRVRDERLRQLAIVIVLALTAYFYWR